MFRLLFTVGVAGIGLVRSCPEGSLGTVCENCGAGHYVPADSVGVCSDFECPAGTTDDDAQADTPCKPCPRGHYVPAKQSGSCTAYECPPGEVDADSLASTPCVACEMGHYTPKATHGPCQPCPAGTSDEDLHASTPCESCRAGTYAPVKSHLECEDMVCPRGTIDDDFNSGTPCKTCDPGVYVPSGQAGSCKASQFACSAGTTDSDADSSTACVPDTSDLYTLATVLGVAVGTFVAGTVFGIGWSWYCLGTRADNDIQGGADTGMTLNHTVNAFQHDQMQLQMMRHQEMQRHTTSGSSIGSPVKDSNFIDDGFTNYNMERVKSPSHSYTQSPPANYTGKRDSTGGIF